MQKYVKLEFKTKGLGMQAYIDGAVVCEQIFIADDSDGNESFSSFMVRVLDIMKEGKFEYYDQFNSGRVLVFKKED